MRERLREITEVLATVPDLLREQAEVVRIAEHLLEQETRLLEVAGTRQALDVPERSTAGGGSRPPDTCA